MIYITGDTHSERERFIKFHELMRAGDYLIVCGDFGYLFDNDEYDNEFLDQLEMNESYEILFADGNHENFNAIYSYPVEQWNGGKVHRIRKNIRHLMRGQVFTIDGKKVFTFGGAYSRDRYVRQKDVSYWEEEIPCVEQFREGLLNLQANNNEVDLIITHTCPSEIIRMMGHYPDRHDEEFTGFLEYIMYENKFRYWCFGHWHTDEWITDKIRAVYFDILKYDTDTVTLANE